MGEDFKEVLEEKKALVWPEIEKYLKLLSCFPSFCRPPRSYQPLVDFHQKMVADYPRRQGKYFRPTLVLLTAAAMGFPEKKALKTAAAMQVSEDWILNHDDIEDDSLQRRGKPTLHRLYGKELAINAGDSLHVLMWKILLDNFSVVGKEKGKKIMEEFWQMLNRTILGQTVEIKWTQENNTQLKIKDVLFILESKTAYYTVAGPMRLGAILAGATEKQLKKIYQFGRYLGWGFQIQDDILDLTSDFAGLKKQQGNDIYEGKRTVILVDLFRKIKGKEKRKLFAIMGKRREEKTTREVKWVMEMMENYGCLDYARRLVKKYIQRAKEFFEKELTFLSRQPACHQLKSAVDFVIERSY
ncbi:polyprenyl synthetase family protein [bacterium]|nr:polyprenyl synthetase family protein [bacterium]